MSVAPGTSTPLRLGPAARAGLDRLRLRLRGALAVRGASTLALALVLLGLLSFALDRSLRLSWGTRAGFLTLAVAASLTVLWRRLLRPLLIRLPDDELARVVERHEPAFQWRLLSAVQFTSPGWRPGPETSRELAGLVVDEAEQAARGADFGRGVPLRGPALSGLRGLVVALAAVGLLRLDPDAAATWARRNLLLSASAAWPRDTVLQVRVVTPGRPEGWALLRRADGQVVLDDGRDGRPELALPRGTELALVASVASGVVPSRVYVESLGPAGAGTQVMESPAKGEFRLGLPPLAEGFSFVVRGGDDELGPFPVRVLAWPWLEELRFEVTPPPHTRLPRRIFGVEAGSVSLPVGTEVRVLGRVSKPLERAWIELQGDTAAVHSGVLEGEHAEDRDERFTVLFGLEQSGVYQVHVRDRDGLGLEQPTRFSLLARPDAPPQVALELQGVGLNITPQATVGARAKAEDDHGVLSASLRWRAAGSGVEARSGAVPLSGLEGPAAAEQGVRLSLEELKLEPTMALTLWAEASDADPRGPNVGSSATITLRVVTPEQLLSELLRRLHEQRLVLERAVAEEEKLAQGLSGRDETTLERAPRTHRDVARLVLRAAEVVDGVVAEMMANRILDQATWDRLTGQVAGPLRETHQGSLRRATHLAEEATRAEGDERHELMARGGSASDQVVRELRAVLARMDRIEELAELVALLKRIIERERALRDRTQQAAGGGR